MSLPFLHRRENDDCPGHSFWGKSTHGTPLLFPPRDIRHAFRPRGNGSHASRNDPEIPKHETTFHTSPANSYRWRSYILKTGKTTTILLDKLLRHLWYDRNSLPRGPAPHQRTPQNSFYFALGDVHFSQDKRGCLIIHAPHLHEQQFITNDLVILHTRTQFEWLGRVDNVINSGGVKLFPENIEHRLSPLISRRFFITSVPDEYLGQMAVIVIEDTPWPANSQQELLDEARKHLAPYEVPKRIYFMDHFKKPIRKNYTENYIIFYILHNLYSCYES